MRVKNNHNHEPKFFCDEESYAYYTNKIAHKELINRVDIDQILEENIETTERMSPFESSMALKLHNSSPLACAYNLSGSKKSIEKRIPVVEDIMENVPIISSPDLIISTVPLSSETSGGNGTISVDEEVTTSSSAELRVPIFSSQALEISTISSEASSVQSFSFAESYSLANGQGATYHEL